MQVVVNKKVLEKMIEEVVNEVSSFHSVRIDEIPAKDDEAPIKPSEQMATQLSTDKPPVDDENYKPVNTAQLTKASAAIAEKVPQDRVQKFYKQLKDLAQSAQDEKKEEQLAEDKIRQIVEYVTGKKLSEAGFKKDPTYVDAMASLDLPSAERRTMTDTQADIKRKSSAKAWPRDTAMDSVMRTVVTGFGRLISQIEDKKGVKFKRFEELSPIKADLLAPGGIIPKRDKRLVMLSAQGVTLPMQEYSRDIVNLTDSDLEEATRKAIEDNFDLFAEKYTTEHFMGLSRRTGTRAEVGGTLRAEAEDIAKYVLKQVGDQLPESSKIDIDELKQFIESQKDFVKNKLSDTDRTSTFEFKDIIPTGKVSVTIDYNDFPQFSQLPQKVRYFSDRAGTIAGFVAGETVDTVQFFKNEISLSLNHEFSNLAQKAPKMPRSKSFTSTGEGRNLASDLLRRLGGRYASASPEKVYQYTRDMAMQSAEEDESLTSKDVDDIQMAALSKIGVLEPDRLDMRRQLVDAFYDNFLNSAIYLASQNFDNSSKVGLDFKQKAEDALGISDAASKASMGTLSGDLFDPLFDIYTDLLKEFGAMPSSNDFIKNYEKIVKLPEYRAYVEKLGGTTRSDVFERSGKFYFDKDTTFIFNLFTAAKYAKSVKNNPKLANLLAGRNNDDIFNVAVKFGDEVANSIEDVNDPITKKAVKKITDLISSTLGVQPKKDKKLKEALALRSMIRRALRD